MHVRTVGVNPPLCVRVFAEAPDFASIQPVDFKGAFAFCYLFADTIYFSVLRLPTLSPFCPLSHALPAHSPLDSLGLVCSSIIISNGPLKSLRLIARSVSR